MGIRSYTIDLMDIGIEAIGKTFPEIRICELGNQFTKDHPKFKTGKKYLTSLGAKHVSFDINGRSGALRVDLSQDIPDKWVNSFDMITNYGTSEHIKQQYKVFKNIHRLVKAGGCMIHAVPQYNYFRKHGYFQYELQFFEKMAEANKYEICLCESRLRHVKKEQYLACAILVKTNKNDFISRDQFKKIPGLKR